MARFVGFVLSVSLVILFSTNVYCVRPVPAVVWQTSSLNSGGLSSVSVVEPLTKDEFNKDVLQKLDIRGPIIMFVEPELSIEDFTLSINPHNEGGETNVFANLQSVVKNNPASMLPSVESPEQTVRDFASGRQIVELDAKAELPNSIDHSLLVVRLPGDKNRKTALANGDKILGEYVEKMNKKYPMYTGVYTGQENSWTDPEGRTRRHIDRHILANNQTNFHVTFNYTNCYLVYFEQVNVAFYQFDSTDSKTDFQFSESLEMENVFSDQMLSCSNNFTELQIDYKPLTTDNGNITSLSMILSFEAKSDGDWYLNSFNVTYKIKDGTDGSNTLNSKNVWAPLEFSYHCGPVTFSHDTYGANDTKYLNVYFENFQIQPFIANGTSLAFGVPWDCVGFFTIGIWMAIFVIAILIIILGFGIYITFVIKTMDRFDDPKGKTIAVNAND